jgi:hypothetical protein
MKITPEQMLEINALRGKLVFFRKASAISVARVRDVLVDSAGLSLSPHPTLPHEPELFTVTARWDVLTWKDGTLEDESAKWCLWRVPEDVIYGRKKI